MYITLLLIVCRPHEQIRVSLYHGDPQGDPQEENTNYFC